MNHYIGQALEQIKADLQAHTRFEPEAITDVQGSTRDCVGTTTVLIDPGIVTQEKKGSGKLPSHVKYIGNIPLYRAVEELQQQANDEVKERLRQWLWKNPHVHRLPGATEIWEPFAVGFDHRCGKCNGNSRESCWSCNGRGSTGFGDDRSSCSWCMGSGSRTCRTCTGTGIVYQMSTVSLTISSSYHYQCSDPEAEDEERDELQAMDFDTLSAYNTFAFEEDRFEEGRFIRRFSATCLITKFSLQIEEETFYLVAYGEDAKVLRFNELASTVLEDDLMRFIKVLQEGGNAILEKQDDLLIATSEFMQSEVHQDLDNQVHLRSKRLSAEYVTEARKAVQEALSRLYINQVFFYWLGTLLLWLLVLGLIYSLGWQGMEGEGPYALPGLALLVGLTILEIYLMYRLSERIESLGEVPIQVAGKILGLAGPWLYRSVLLLLLFLAARLMASV